MAIKQSEKDEVIGSLMGLNDTYAGSQGTVEWIRENGLKDMAFRDPNKFDRLGSKINGDYETLMADLREFIGMLKEARINPDGKGAQTAPPDWKRPDKLGGGSAHRFFERLRREGRWDKTKGAQIAREYAEQVKKEREETSHE